MTNEEHKLEILKFVENCIDRSYEASGRTIDPRDDALAKVSQEYQQIASLSDVGFNILSGFIKSCCMFGQDPKQTMEHLLGNFKVLLKEVDDLELEKQKRMKLNG